MKKSTSKKKKLSTKKKKTSKKVSKKTKKKVSDSLHENLDLSYVQEVHSFMKEEGLLELGFRKGDFELHLLRASDAVVAPSVPVSSTPAPVMSAQSSVVESPSNGVAASTKQNVKEIKSPFVGTFYRAASPDEDPFVEEGKSVSAGDSLCIVEAMKLMNEIEADWAGTIRKIYPEDGASVEYGETLFELELS